MTFKLTSLIFFTLAVFMVFIGSAQTAEALPYWCTCGENASKTHSACNSAGGNWDNGSCGCDQAAIHNNFIYFCGRANGAKPRCWE